MFITDIMLRHFRNLQFMPPLQMTRLGQPEVLEHLMFIDVGSGFSLSGDELAKCNKRFVKFCQDQFENRSRN